MKYLISFGIDFGIIFLLSFLAMYYFMKKKEYEKLEDGDFVKIFIAKYNLDIRKTSFKKIIVLLTFNNAFILAFTASLIVNIKGYGWKLAVAFVVLLVLYYALYELTGRILKKKEGKKKNV